MTKLITITLRWMRRDKKRTLLSFFSIVMAMYMMTFLGLYFSSFVSILRSQEGYGSGTYHVQINGYGLETAVKLSRNTAVSEWGYVSDFPQEMFYDSFLEKYRDSSKGGSDCYFPRVMINGRDIAEKNDEPYTGSISDGDIRRLSGMAETNDLRGRMPERDGEVTIDPAVADLYNIGIGGKLTLRYEVDKCSLEYTCQRIPRTLYVKDADGSSHREFNYEQAEWENADEYGEPVFAEDKDGKVINRLYGYLQELPGELPAALHDMLYSEYPFSFEEHSDPDNEYSEVKAQLDYVMKLKPAGETVEYTEKTFTVVGIMRSSRQFGTFNFHAGDEWAVKNIPEGVINFFGRIKEGLDIDTEGRQMCESVGLIADGLNEAGLPEKHLNTNDDLIFYEGRGFEKATNVLVMFLAFILITAVFVLFARLIVNNAFELSSAYRAEQYGALKTVSASNRQIFAMVMTECLLYVAAALPLAVGLAIVTGKMIMSKIMDIRIFDLKYGEGVTEQFFSLEIIPAILIAVVGVAVFSVIMSGYACAIRIRKLSPIQAASGKKNAGKPLRRSWFSRRHFGFAAGYAARSAARGRMHGTITLLAAVISGTLVVAITSMIYGIEKNMTFTKELNLYDYEISYMPYDVEGELSVTEQYRKLTECGLFTIVEPLDAGCNQAFFSQNGEMSEAFLSQFTDEYKAFSRDNTGYLENLFVYVEPLTRNSFENLECGLSYDELVKSKGIIVCNSLISGDGEIMDIKAFKDGLTGIVLPDRETGKDITVPLTAYCTASDSTYASTYMELRTFVPVERWDDFQRAVYGGRAAGQPVSFLVKFAEGRDDEAMKYIAETSSGGTSYVAENRTGQRIAEALKLAGLSLSAVIFAVALINILSTSGAKIVNRRRELSMLRTCGMSLRQVIASLVIEAAVCGVVTAGLSAVLGQLMGGFFFGLIDAEVMPSLPWFSVLAVGGSVFLLMLAACLPTLMKLRRSAIAAEIRSKE